MVYSFGLVALALLLSGFHSANAPSGLWYTDRTAKLKTEYFDLHWTLNCKKQLYVKVSKSHMITIK